MKFTLTREIELKNRHIRVLKGIPNGDFLWWRDNIIGRVHDELAGWGLINGGGDDSAELTRLGRQILNSIKEQESKRIKP